MQRLGFLTFLFILVCPSFAIGNDNLLQTANQIVHLSEEMVFHGSEGHLHEIVDNGEKMITEIYKVTRDLKSLKKSNQKELQKSIKAVRDKTEEAIRRAKQGNLVDALASARSASFHAKRVRQAFH